MKKLTPIVLILLIMQMIATPQNSLAKDSPTPAPEPDNLMSLSLEDLMNLDVAVSGKAGLSLRETPGIVTVITEEEIKNSGARNMVDVLRLVPGIHINGHDENTLVLGIRGHAAQEGKVLVMIDGLQFNEGRSGGVVFGDRILPDNIHKIEIIRGPGSAIYGGLAGLAVINFVTKSAIELDNGGYFSVTSGVSNQDQSRFAAQFGAGRNITDDFSISLTGNASLSNLSNETSIYDSNRRHAQGDTIYNYADSSRIKNIMLNLGVNYKGIKLKTIYQQYGHENTFDENDYDEYDPETFEFIRRVSRPEADYVDNSGLFTQASYDWNVNDLVTITPTLSWKQQAGKGSRGGKQVEDSEYIQQNQVYNTYRSMANITAVISPTSWLKATAGVEYYEDRLRRHLDADTAVTNTGQSFTFGGKKSIAFDNKSAFAEVLFETNIVNVVIGGRYDHHSQYGDAFVPRFALTKATDNYHVKLLASRAFKAPVMENILNSYGDADFYRDFEGENGETYGNMKPEHITVYEAELGYMPTSNLSLLTNVFYTRIDDPIVSRLNLYTNVDHVATSGIEVEARWKDQLGYLSASYSYYRNQDSESDFTDIVQATFGGQTEFQTLETAHSNLLRGMPAHKVVINGGVYIGEQFTVAPSVILDSKKYEYAEFYDRDSGETVLIEYENDPTAILNLSLHYHPDESLRLSLSCFDILNEQYRGAYTSNLNYYGTPTMGRELTFKASYMF